MTYITTQLAPGCLFTSTTTQTVAATTSETTIIGSGSGSLTIPANYLIAGKVLRFELRGLYSTPLLNVGSVTIRVKLGTTTLETGSASALLASVTNAGFEGSGLITCRTVGVSGTVIIMGGVTYGVGNNMAPLVTAVNNGTSAVTIDTTTSQVFNITIQWSNNTAGNSVSSLNCSLEALN